jgi:hypothetical protein
MALPPSVHEFEPGSCELPMKYIRVFIEAALASLPREVGSLITKKRYLVAYARARRHDAKV